MSSGNLLHSMLTNSSVMNEALSSSIINVYCKDKQGRYLEVNNVFEKTAAYSANSIIGQTDYDLWYDLAENLQKTDKEVIYTEHSKTIIENVTTFGKETSSFLSYKTPLYSNSRKKIGVFCVSFLLCQADAIKEWAKLVNLPIAFNNQPSLVNDEILSQRQKECLLYLVRGMTMKQIARNMEISVRTVEHYLEAIKIKLNCDTRSQLIQKALQLSFVREAI